MVEYLDDICSYTVEHNPLDWHKRGLQQTASGYGKRLTSPNVVVLPDGCKRRIYITQFGNAGSAWITLDGRKLFLRG